MRRSIKKAIITIICCVLLLGQSLTCLANNNQHDQTSPNKEGTVSEPIKTPQPTPPGTLPTLPKDAPIPPKNPEYAQPVISESLTFTQIESILEFWHTSIPDNSTPADYDLRGDSWNVYQLISESKGELYIQLFGNTWSEVTVDECDAALYQAELLEKLDLVPIGFELTANLNDLTLFMADGGRFPHTKNNGQLFTGTMQILPYNGVIHHVVISEEYTVRPGDTISQIILDCGWLPEGSHLYGPNGYLKQYTEQQGIDLDRVLMPGDVIRWRSEDIQVVDNLNPDIKIGIIPGQIFSGGNPASF